MAKDVIATPHRSKLTLDDRRVNFERQAMQELTAEPCSQVPPDWATLARKGIHDRRTRPDE